MTGDGSGSIPPEQDLIAAGNCWIVEGGDGPRARQDPLFFSSLVLALLISFNLFAQQGPFPHRIQNPVYLQTVNLDPERAVTLPAGMLEFRADSAYSNLFERTNPAPFDVTMDMELWRVSYEYVYGLPKNWEVALEVATLHWEGGFLDPFIQGFHHAFGFPNGGRERANHNDFLYEVRQNGTVLFQSTPQDLNAGDLTLSAKNLVWEEGSYRPAVAWRFGYKIPSGDPALGLGSGEAGFGLGLAFEKSFHRFHTYLNTNYLFDGGQSRLDGLMNTIFFDYSLAGELEFSKRVSAITQLVGGTPRLKSVGFHVWDGVPLDLILGFKGDVPLASGGQALGKRLRTFLWQVGFAEDVTSKGPSVDFTAWASVGLRFGH